MVFCVCCVSYVLAVQVEGMSSEAIKFSFETSFDIGTLEELTKEQKSATFATSRNGIAYKWHLQCRFGTREGTVKSDGKPGNRIETRKLVDLRLIPDKNSFTVPCLMGTYVLLAVPRNDDHTKFKKKDVNRVRELSDLRTGVTFIKKDLHSYGYVNNKQEVKFVVLIEIKSQYFEISSALMRDSESLRFRDDIEPVPKKLFDIDEKPACGGYFTIAVGPDLKEFYCSPKILEMNCLYFKDLLNADCNFKEKQEARVEFECFDPESMRVVLRYIHLAYLPEWTDKTTDVKQIVKIAHRFQLPWLLRHCELPLSSFIKLSTGNAVEVAVFAHTYGFQIVRNKALNEIADRIDELRKSPDMVKLQVKIKEGDWKTLEDEVYELVVQRMRCSRGHWSVNSWV